MNNINHKNYTVVTDRKNEISKAIDGLDDWQVRDTSFSYLVNSDYRRLIYVESKIDDVNVEIAIGTNFVLAEFRDLKVKNTEEVSAINELMAELKPFMNN